MPGKGTAQIRGASRGQALVEFAIVLPVILLILAAIIQFALIFERQIGIENAVREVARATASLPTDDTNAVGNADWAYDCLHDLAGNPSDRCGRNLLVDNVQGYNEASVQAASVCFDSPRDGSGNPQLDASGHAQVVVTASVSYGHPLFMPVVALILDGIDGSNDGALRIDTKSEFRVENAEDASTTLTAPPVCSDPASP